MATNNRSPQTQRKSNRYSVPNLLSRLKGRDDGIPVTNNESHHTDQKPPITTSRIEPASPLNPDGLRSPTILHPDSVALVTGAASGIGKAILLDFLHSGCTKLVAADLSAKGLKELEKCVADINADAKVLAVETDVTKAESVEGLVKAAVQEFGRIDHSVHAAGVADSNAVRADETAEEGFDFVVGVNLKGVWLCEKYVLKQMKEQEPRTLENGVITRGSVVNIASILGLVGFKRCSPYVASKHGVSGITKADAADYAEFNIRVNAVAPGFVRTNLIAHTSFDFVEQGYTQLAPMKRLGFPEEIAKSVTFLISDMASYITGVVLPVDGGQTCV